MGLWNNAPPEPRTRAGNWPTLLFSWWCTAFAVVIILTRLAGRKIRSGRLFQEDKVMALSLIPLLARMGLVHVILMYGTNNVDGVDLTPYQIHLRQIGSKLVLASRINYALFIWISKFTVSEFLKRITSAIWRRSYEITLHCIRVFLVATFIAVVIATLAECQPFDHVSKPIILTNRCTKPNPIAVLAGCTRPRPSMQTRICTAHHHGNCRHDYRHFTRRLSYPHRPSLTNTPEAQTLSRLSIQFLRRPCSHHRPAHA